MNPGVVFLLVVAAVFIINDNEVHIDTINPIIETKETVTPLPEGTTPSPEPAIILPNTIKNVSYTNIGETYSLFWQVHQGVGCCNTYDCNYDLFSDACLEPFTLYDIYIDGTKYDWGDMVNYTYYCVNETPWNVFKDIPLTASYITIDQKDCYDVVDTYEVST